MVWLLTIFLPLCFMISSVRAEKDWSSVILQSQAKEGQNFEQDQQLIQAYLQMERRSDALRVLRKWAPLKSEEWGKKQFELAGSLFFNQETSNLYFEAVRLLSVRSWSEAREKLEAALKKEPDHLFVLARLIQVETQLGQKASAVDRTKTALDWYPSSVELRIFKAKQDLDEGELKAALKTFSQLKAEVLNHELPTLWYFETLHQLKKSSEILPLQRVILRKRPEWIELRFWLLRNGTIYSDQASTLRAELEKALGEPKSLNEKKETEYRQGQYYWVSSYSTDQLKAEFEQWVGP